MDRRAFVRYVGTVGTAGLAGCLGGGGTNNAGDTDTPSPTSTGPPGARDTYPGYAWGTVDEASPTVTASVTAEDYGFDPVVVKVPPGTTVTFTNKDPSSHTVSIPRLEIDKGLRPRGTTELTIEQTGKFDYICSKHRPNGVGRVVVSEDAPTPDSTSAADE